MVVSKVDVPGHASGMRSLALPQEGTSAGPLLQYCKDDRQKTIFGDSRGDSAQVIGQLIREIAGLFPDELFHVGGDETIPIGKLSCNSSVEH